MTEDKVEQPLRRYWLSWYGNKGSFELHQPWWITGERGHDGVDILCAAILARSLQAAMEQVVVAHEDNSIELEWRFCEEQSDNWSPFSDRLPRASWMQWPD